MKHARIYIAVLGLVFAMLTLAFSAAAQDAPAGNIIPLDHPYAAFLETRAYADSVGATAEFRKMEWVYLDNDNMRFYVTISEVARGMSDGEGDINIDENVCGLVYYADMDENYVISELRPLLVGGPYNPETNTCDENNISSPDGLWMDGRGRLWIAEDTDYHENNMLWVYDPADGSLKRFGYVPLGAEVTGAFVTEQGAVFFSNQHPVAQNRWPHNAGTIVAVNGFNANTDDFESIEVPTGDDRLTIGVAAGELQLLGRAGDPIPNSIYGHILGGTYDVNGDLMTVNNDPDGLMWLPADEAGTSGILYANFEGRPGGVARLNLNWEMGAWQVVDGEMVDFSDVRGTWNNCGSSVTPWNTGLTSEESEPNASDFANVRPMTAYLGEQANPYDYGWIVELEPDELSDAVTKRYVMGRSSQENSFVAGDERTVYFGHDGTNYALVRFVAAEAGDLSAGTLYAARVTQTGGTANDGHTLQLEWIELGTATDADVEAAIRELDM